MLVKEKPPTPPSAKAIDFSCKDWKEKITHSRSLMPEGIRQNLSPDAEKALNIFGNLCLPDVVGTPRLSDSCGPWIFDLVSAIAGTVADGNRWCREFFALICKKNSKTSSGAGVMLTMLLMNKRPNAEYLIVSPSLEVSSLCFNQLTGMIRHDEELSILFKIKEHVKTVIFLPTGAFLKVKTCSPTILTGSKPVGILIDEMHVLGEMSNADRIMGQIRGGIVSQKEGFILTITTQSERPPTGLFASELNKVRQVRDGKISLPIMPMLYEFPDYVDWRDVNNWHMVNPNHGFSVDVHRLHEDFIGAQADGEAELRRWASQHLNIQIGVGLAAGAWAGADFWEENVDEQVSLDYVLANSDTVAVGIDGGGLNDLLGLCILGRHLDTGQWLAWFHAWAHPKVLQNLAQDVTNRLRDFEDDGDLTFSDKVGDDLLEVAEICLQVYDSGLLERIGVDRIGLGGTLEAIINAGVPQDKIIAIPQNYHLNGAIMTAERKLAAHSMLHNGSRLMNWCVGNAVAELKGSAWYIAKSSAKNKIDPLMALFDGVSVLMTAPERKADVSDWIV